MKTCCGAATIELAVWGGITENMIGTSFPYRAEMPLHNVCFFYTRVLFYMLGIYRT